LEGQIPRVSGAVAAPFRRPSSLQSAPSRLPCGFRKTDTDSLLEVQVASIYTVHQVVMYDSADPLPPRMINMAQFYTLEEAAHRLNIPVDVFKRRIKTEWTSIRPFRDGATLRFRTADIDELARTLGEASDPGLAPGPIGSAPVDDDSSELAIALTPDVPRPYVKPKPNRLDDEPLLIAADDDIFGAEAGKGENDSDVRLDFATTSGNLDPSNYQPTEEITVDLSGPSSAIIKPSSGSGKLSAPKSGTKLAGPDSGKIPAAGGIKAAKAKDDSSSEFELSLDSSNDSLELEINGDSSEEVDLGGLGLLPEKSSGQSGLNLGKPADSGLSLEKRGTKTGPLGLAAQPSTMDSADDFELSLDMDDSDSFTRGPKSAVMSSTGPASDSEFELTLDEDSGVAEAIAGELQEEANNKDIFETDFEVRSLDDSDSELVAANDADSDFDLDVGEMEATEESDASGSQVLLVEDEDAEPILDDEDDRPKKRPRNLRDAFGDEDLEEGASASGALRGLRRGEDGYETSPSQVVVATPAKWGALPTVVLGLTLPLMLMGTLMSYENLRGMWGYHQTAKPGSLLARPLAEAITGKTIGD